MRAVPALLLLLAVSCSRQAPAPEPWLLPSDVLELRAISPKGAELLERAEQARRSGRDDDAITLYRESAVELPTRDVPRRFECLLQAERGRHAEAVQACEAATNARNTAAGRRAFVAALLAGTTPPSPTELARAASLTDHLMTTVSGSAYGYAAMCDIGLQVGDEDMVMQNLEQLRKVAPDHYDTLRLERLLGARRPSGAHFLAWVLFVGLLSFSAWHAIRRVARKPRARALAAATALLACSLLPAVAFAEPSLPAPLSDWPIDPADPERSLPSVERMNNNPLQAGYHLMDLSERAEYAKKTGDHAAVVKYYRAIAKMVPERSVAFGKMCEAYEALGEIENAIKACSEAATRFGVRIEDYVRYSRLVFRGPEALTPPEVAALGDVIQHLRGQGDAAAIAGERIACELGFRQDDEKRLTECTAALDKLAPNDPQTVSYEWSLAILRRDTPRAKALTQRARDLGVKPEVIAKMEAATQAAQPFWRRPMSILPLGLVSVALVGAAVVFVRRRRRPLPEAAP